MKVRKRYSIVINSNTMVATLTKYNHWWVNYIQEITTCGIRIYDCSFVDTVYNLRILKKNGYYISKRK